MFKQKSGLICALLALLFLHACDKSGSDKPPTPSPNSELKIVVDFPIDGSNTGGDASNIHIRGHIANEAGNKITPDGYQVVVNGITAGFAPDGSGYWIAEIPISEGTSSISVHLNKSGSLVTQNSLTIKNSPINTPDEVVTDGSTYLYSLSLGEQHVLRSSLSGDDQTSIVNMQALRELTDCIEIENIHLLQESNRLLINCLLEGKESALFSFNLSSGNLDLLVERIALSSAPHYRVYGDILITSDGRDILHFINLSGQTAKSITLTYEGAALTISPDTFIKDSKLYVQGGNFSTPSRWFYLELMEVLSSVQGNNSLSVIDAEFDIPYNHSNVEYLNGALYSVNLDGLTRTNITANNSSFEEVIQRNSTTGKAIWGEGELPSPRLAGSDSEHLILQNQLDFQLYKLNIINLEAYALNSPINRFSQKHEASITYEQNKIAIYDFWSRRLTIHDLKNLDFVSSSERPSSNFESSLPSSMRFNWTNQKMYLSRIADWYGVQSDWEYFPYNLVSYDTATRIENNLLNQDIVETKFLTHSRIDDIALNEEDNTIWVSVSSHDSVSPAFEGVYVLDTSNNQLEELYQAESSSIWLAGIRLSPYSKEISGSAMTKTYGGSVTLLKKDGSTVELLASNSAYPATRYADIDARLNRIYFEGHQFHDEPSGELDLNTLEINEYDLATEQTRIAASRSKGTGLPLPKTGFKVDESRSVLLSFSKGFAYIIDPYTGDRVVKQVSAE